MWVVFIQSDRYMFAPTETKLDKNMNIDVSDTGYQFYLLERDYKVIRQFK